MARCLAAAAAVGAPWHRILAVLRPHLRPCALSKPGTPIGPTNGWSRGAANRTTMPRSPRSCGAIVSRCFAWPCPFSARHSRGSRRRRPGRDAARASCAGLVPRRVHVRVLDLPHRVQPGAQRQGARPIPDAARERSGAGRDGLSGSRPARPVAGRAAEAGGARVPGELPEVYQSALRLHYWLGASVGESRRCSMRRRTR